MALSSYEKQLEAEALRWADHVNARQVKRSWLQSSVVIEHVNQRTTGDARLDWVHWVNREFVRRTDGGRALSLGCNDGEFERQLVSAGIVRELDGIDISPQAIANAQEAANRDGVAAHFRVADVNTLQLEPESYDIVLCVMAMHHFERLEPLLDQIDCALKPNGYLILNEYVGASRFQWSARQLQLATDVLNVLPPRRRRLRDGSVREVIVAPPLAEILRTDPFEAVRSAEIMSRVRDRLHVVAECDYGGSILHLVLHDIVHNFDESLTADREVLGMLCGIEQLLLEHGDLDSDFSVVVAQKRPSSVQSNPPIAFAQHEANRPTGDKYIGQLNPGSFVDNDRVAGAPSGNPSIPYRNKLAAIREARSIHSSVGGLGQLTRADAVSRVAHLENLLSSREAELEAERRLLRAVERGRVLRALNKVQVLRRRIGI